MKKPIVIMVLMLAMVGSSLFGMENAEAQVSAITGVQLISGQDSDSGSSRSFSLSGTLDSLITAVLTSYNDDECPFITGISGATVSYKINLCTGGDSNTVTSSRTIDFVVAFEPGPENGNPETGDSYHIILHEDSGSTRTLSTGLESIKAVSLTTTIPDEGGGFDMAVPRLVGTPTDGDIDYRLRGTDSTLSITHTDTREVFILVTTEEFVEELHIASAGCQQDGGTGNKKVATGFSDTIHAQATPDSTQDPGCAGREGQINEMFHTVLEDRPYFDSTGFWFEGCSSGANCQGLSQPQDINWIAFSNETETQTPEVVAAEIDEFSSAFVTFIANIGFSSPESQMLFSIILIAVTIVIVGIMTRLIGETPLRRILAWSCGVLAGVFCVLVFNLELWMFLVSVVLGGVAVFGLGPMGGLVRGPVPLTGQETVVELLDIPQEEPEELEEAPMVVMEES